MFNSSDGQRKVLSTIVLKDYNDVVYIDDRRQEERESTCILKKTESNAK